jgi:hypothetical protein
MNRLQIADYRLRNEWRLVLVGLCLLMIMACQPAPDTESAFHISHSTDTGKVVAVSDGYTIEAQKADSSTVRVRLQGVDAPEKAQDLERRQSSSPLIWCSIRMWWSELRIGIVTGAWSAKYFCWMAARSIGNSSRQDWRGGIAIIRAMKRLPVLKPRPALHDAACGRMRCQCHPGNGGIQGRREGNCDDGKNPDRQGRFSLIALCRVV